MIKWKEQHPKITKSTQALVDIIEQLQTANEMYVLNFIVLFVNSIIEKTTSGAIETRSLLKLIEVENKENINWFKYINHTLVKSKKIWKPNCKNSYYSGPLPFLIVRII